MTLEYSNDNTHSGFVIPSIFVIRASSLLNLGYNSAC